MQQRTEPQLELASLPRYVDRYQFPDLATRSLGTYLDMYGPILVRTVLLRVAD